MAIFNVKDFGALGNGDPSENDTQAIQQSLDALPASGGAIYIPAGTYIITRTLKPSSNTRIFGDGAFSILQRKNDRDLNGLQMVYAEGVENIIIERLAFDFNGFQELQDGRKSFASAVAFRKGASNIKIRDLKIYDSNPQGTCCATGILLLESSDIWIENNVLENGPRIKAGGLNQRVTVRGNYLRNPNDNGITIAIPNREDNSLTSDYLIQGNIVEGARGSAIYLGDDGGEGPGEQRTSSIVISENILRGPVLRGQRLIYVAIGSAMQRIHVCNNLLENQSVDVKSFTEGILVKSKKNSTVTAKDILIANNTIIGQFDHGHIWLNQVERVRICQNQVGGLPASDDHDVEHRISEIGIRLTQSKFVTLASNQISHLKLGLKVEGTLADLNVNANSFARCERCAIYFDATSEASTAAFLSANFVGEGVEQAVVVQSPATTQIASQGNSWEVLA